MTLSFAAKQQTSDVEYTPYIKHFFYAAPLTFAPKLATKGFFFYKINTSASKAKMAFAALSKYNSALFIKYFITAPGHFFGRG